jgi:hypothetical protein
LEGVEIAGKLLTVEEVLTVLAETPLLVAAATGGLRPAQLRATPEFGGWSLYEVLGHLRSCADVWGGCCMRILAEDWPTVRAIDPRTWLKGTDYLELDFRSSFERYRRQRREFLEVLELLSPEDWSRSATVTGAGAVLERTAQFYAQWMARHERSHYRQIKTIAHSIRA